MQIPLHGQRITLSIISNKRSSHLQLQALVRAIPQILHRVNHGYFYIDLLATLTTS